ncbi:armadillo-type protein [Cristinia sonorae]|uniref:Armadillo-type protein n=1 Tax=Cristinia sonorae TaxID=1940300 RepID=A0A8K0URR1_9AGAR|nr:armadillo-type protein [Cristinia sonorae]
MTPGDQTQHMFTKLKASCVPLLGNSLLTPASIPIVSNLLQQITFTLREAAAHSALKPSLINYVFIPISTVFQRNASTAIPDHVLERLFIILALLCESWWWDLDSQTWEQIFMLSGAVIGGLEGSGKDRERDDETKMAAVQCLWALLHERTPESDPALPREGNRAEVVLARLRLHTQTDKFMPIMGQTIHSLLATANSQHRPLQKLSLDVLLVITKDYLVDRFAPTILPGVTSTTCKIALGIGHPRGWANGDVVSTALSVMGNVISLAVGDEACVRDGAIKGVDDLESLTQLFTDSSLRPLASTLTPLYYVSRTPSWLEATTAQLHMALVSLQPLVMHQTPSAQEALATLSRVVLKSATQTLSRSCHLLLSYLLSLSVDAFPDVSTHAKRCLQDVLSGSRQHTLLHALLQISKDNMISLPRLISIRAEGKLLHATGIIQAICEISFSQSPAASAVRGGIDNLLGPNGGIERWGWNLLSVLEFTTTSVVSSPSSAGHLLLTSSSEFIPLTPFPDVIMRTMSSDSTHALQRMFFALGKASGEDCLYAVEWFFGVSRAGREITNVAAGWCAARLLEGAAHVPLGAETGTALERHSRSKRLERFVRNMTRSIAEVWDEALEESDSPSQGDKAMELEVSEVKHVVGLLPIRGSMDQNASLPSAEVKPSTSQDILHRMLMLQLLSVAAGVLEVRFVSTLMHTLFPILHSLISDHPPLAMTALAALQTIANAMSYASPANLLLSNFDYALDAVSQRLNRRRLDVDATSVLVILVRMVGRDVVTRAGDVVEECFDRLDEYHGYELLVNGFMSVLLEVVEAIAADSETQSVSRASQDATKGSSKERMQRFREWFAHRNNQNHPAEYVEDEDVGPVPQEAWSSSKQDEDEGGRAADPVEEIQSTPAQRLVQHIISRSMYFLTHESRLIRARILALLAPAATVLPASLILPSIHHAWPFVLNRLADPEPFVISAAANLVEALSTHFGEFMYNRIWDDVWPRFRRILRKLETADAGSALARKGVGAVGTESAYTHSHRLYRAILRTMTAAVREVQAKDNTVWEVAATHRRFLHREAHEELQGCARELYAAIGRNNEDAVWFVLMGTQGSIGSWVHLHESNWDVRQNADMILRSLGNT